MINVFEKQLDDLKEIVPSFYVANATCHFDEHSPHLHIVGVPVKENCKTGLSRQVGKTSIFTKESLVSQFEEARAEIDSMISILGSSEDAPEVKILKDLFVTADNVLTKGHNSVDINVKLKDGKDVSDVLFLGFEPRLYDVSFSSK